MLQFPPFPFLPECSLTEQESHSEIPGSKAPCASPRLIAAWHVLLRWTKPSHPPGGAALAGPPWPTNPMVVSSYKFHTDSSLFINQALSVQSSTSTLHPLFLNKELHPVLTRCPFPHQIRNRKWSSLNEGPLKRLALHNDTVEKFIVTTTLYTFRFYSIIFIP